MQLPTSLFHINHMLIQLRPQTKTVTKHLKQLTENVWELNAGQQRC